jgi:hypothetical protein
LEFAYEVFKKTNIMENGVIEAWYNLYKTKDGKFFLELMELLK